MNISKKYVFYLVFGFFALILFVFSLLFNPKAVRNKNGNTTVNSNQINTPSQIVGFRDKSLTSQDTYLADKTSFGALLGDYIATGDFSIRLRLESIKQLAAKTYPKDFKATDFILPCLDAACEKKEPSANIQDIINKSKQAGGINFELDTKKAIENSLLSTAYYPSDSQNVLSLYLSSYGGFQSLYSVAATDKDKVDIQLVADNLKNEIKTQFPTAYASFNTVHFFDLTNKK